MRLVELAVSVRRIRQRPDDLVAEPNLFPAMALLHSGLVLGPLAEVLWLGRAWNPVEAGVAAFTLIVATSLRVWTLRTIGLSWNVRVVTPPPDGIATTGPYHWIRHPNYLVVVLEIAALPMFHGAWMSAIVLSLLNAAVLSVRIPTEEAVLMQVPAWRAWFADKSRLIPGLL